MAGEHDPADEDHPVLVTTDLWMQSRVAAAARRAGVRLRVVAAPPLPPGPGVVVVDCNQRQPERLRLIAALAAEPSRRPVLALLPHRDRVTRDAARAAGARCVPNSAIAGGLSALLGGAPPAAARGVGGGPP